VERVDPAEGGSGRRRVVLADGRSVVASQGVVVATEGPEAGRLLGDKLQVSVLRACVWCGGWVDANAAGVGEGGLWGLMRYRPG